jgi:hypothetical protein
MRFGCIIKCPVLKNVKEKNAGSNAAKLFCRSRRWEGKKFRSCASEIAPQRHRSFELRKKFADVFFVLPFRPASGSESRKDSGRGTSVSLDTCRSLIRRKRFPRGQLDEAASA